MAAMPRFLRHVATSTLGLSLLAAAGWSQAQPTAAETAPARKAAASTEAEVRADSPILAPEAQRPESPESTLPKRSRAISPGVAAALAAATPKYTPPAPPPPPKPESELVDMREIDKPKNGIVRLPKYLVRERKPVILREENVYTQKGIEDMAVRRYMSEADRALNRFTIPFIGMSMKERAMAMYAEDQRLKNMADLRDSAMDTARVDPAGGEYIRKEAQKTFLRSADFGWSSGEPR